MLSNEKTLQLYRENAKKTNDPELIFEFAVFMIEAAKSLDANTAPDGQTHPNLSSTTAPLSAQHKAPNTQPATAAADTAALPSGTTSLGTVRLSRAVKANGEALP